MCHRPTSRAVPQRTALRRRTTRRHTCAQRLALLIVPLHSRRPTLEPSFSRGHGVCASEEDPRRGLPFAFLWPRVRGGSDEPRLSPCGFLGLPLAWLVYRVCRVYARHRDGRTNRGLAGVSCWQGSTVCAGLMSWHALRHAAGPRALASRIVGGTQDGYTSRLRPNGGIGRRTGLKIPWG